MLPEVLDALIRASLAGSLGAVLVLILRVPVRWFFGARTAYSLWILAPLMAAASLIPTPAALALPLPQVLPSLAREIGGPVLIFWLAGAALLAAALAAVHGRFLWALGKPSLDGGGLPILRARDDKAVGPAVVGVISAKIVLPANFEGRYSETERAMVLAHERNHLFGHDAQAITLSALLRCLNWFNPLAHLCAHLFRIDQELACDAAVLAQYPKARRTYAEALLKTQLAGSVPPFGCQWPAKGENPLEQCIALLSAPVQGKRRKLLGGGLVAGLALFASALSWAAEPAPLFAMPVNTLHFWAGLKDDPAFMSHVPPKVVQSGETITRFLEVAEGEYYSVTLTPTLQRSGMVSIAADIEKDGQVVRRTTVMLEQGEPRKIRVGGRNLLVSAKVAN